MSEKAVVADNQQGRLQLRIEEPSETIRRTLRMNRELAIFLGLLFTDGCISPKGNSWRIYFSNKSQTLIDLFRDCMIKVFNLDEKRVLMGKTSNGFLKAVVNSKEIGNYLVSKFGTFRTLSFENGIETAAKLPVKELLDSGYASEFLRAAFSGDGGLSFYPASRKGKTADVKWLIRTIFLSCKHSGLRIDYINLLRAFDIKVRNVPGDGKIKIETKSDIQKFRDKIGFLENVAATDHSKYWRNYPKQQILELMVSSYEEPSKTYNLPKFIRSDDIVRPV